MHIQKTPHINECTYRLMHLQTNAHTDKQAHKFIVSFFDEDARSNKRTAKKFSFELSLYKFVH